MASGRDDPTSEGREARSVAKDKDDASTSDKRAVCGEPGEIKEIGGPKGPEPTRYGDWEKAGRCIDF